MITGGYDESRSPEARNARPFVRLLARGTVEPDGAHAASEDTG
jgi:hypothetical protein